MKKSKWHNHNSSILDPEPCLSYVTSDGEWAAIPVIGCKKYVIIHGGGQFETARNYDSAITKIERYTKKKIRRVPPKKVSHISSNPLLDALS